MQRLPRRTIIRGAATGLSVAFFGTGRKQVLAASEGEPHFLFQVVFRGGADCSYLFDARSMAFTAAGKMQNYLNEEPTLWSGSNGGKTLATSLVGPLKPYGADFSILNGVLMAMGFDGHEQNLNYLFTGNPFGGETFLPHVNFGANAMPLDFLQIGDSYGLELSNTAGSVKLEPSLAKQLSAALLNAAVPSSSDPVIGYLEGRMAKIGPVGNDGLFARGARQMMRGLSSSESLEQKLKQVSLDLSGDKTAQTIALVKEYFKLGIAKGAVVLIDNGTLDTHDAAEAKAQPESFREVVATIAAIFKAFKETPFDASTGKSLLDVTTILVASEFSRTMRQSGEPIGHTGTDHNNLNNSVIVGGKGIRGGLVIGASDLDTLDDQGHLTASKAHQELDGALIKMMGKPFDFGTMTSRTIMPVAFDPVNYLQFASIANTIYKMFGADASRYWLTKRNGPVAATLDNLLS